MSRELVQAITVTAELTNTALSGAAIAMMVRDLAAFEERSTLRALDRCRKELTGRLTLAAIIDRLNENDGRPTSDEAWAMSLEALDEAKTVVWTDEARAAFSIARPVLAEGDKVGARMAFRDAYDRIVRESRERAIPAKWSASLGWDKSLREVALRHAEAAGLLPAPQVAALLPVMGAGVVGDALFGNPALPAPADCDADVVERVKALKQMLADSTERKAREAEERAAAERWRIANRKREIAEQVRSHQEARGAA